MSVWVGEVQLTAFFSVCDATKLQGCTVANTIVFVPSPSNKCCGPLELEIAFLYKVMVCCMSKLKG